MANSLNDGTRVYKVNGEYHPHRCEKCRYFGCRVCYRQFRYMTDCGDEPKEKCFEPIKAK